MSSSAQAMTRHPISLEINGVPCQAERGQMIIQVADKAGIYIPRFCYHKKLSIAANCRMCLVEVEGVAKPLPACATPVGEGMKVLTESPLAVGSQKGVMEFLLINHPLDCPICDQGGECELQDLALGYGSDVSRYAERKRVVLDKDIGPLIATDMTRCIHCTRCVRFGTEIAGFRELGATGRGEHMEIGTFIQHGVTSEMSGNVIDLCPVGALTSKPFRFKARAWELTQRETIAPHDSIGSTLYVHVRGNRVMRVVPRDNEAINETWISDRDRFSYEGLYSEDRLQVPMVKIEGRWQEVDWDDALRHVVDGLNHVIQTHGADQLGALVSPTATLEEMALMAKLIRGLGSGNIDHRLRQADFRDPEDAPPFPFLGRKLADLERLDAALLIGSNVRKDLPIAAHRLREATHRGCDVLLVNPIDFDFHFPVSETIVASPADMVIALAAIAKARYALANAPLPDALKPLLKAASVADVHREIASKLQDAAQGAVLLGNLAVAHPDFSVLRALAAAIAEVSGATLGYLPEAANTVGAWLAGVLPHRSAGGRAAKKVGLDAHAMLSEPLKAYVLFGLEPEADTWDPVAARKILMSADFVVALCAYRSDGLDACADVLLPLAAFTETSGTFVNLEGTWQSFSGVVAPLGDARPGWKVLRVLGNLLGQEGFDYMSAEEVRDELRAALGVVRTEQKVTSVKLSLPAPARRESLQRISDVPIYAGDGLLRRADALQATVDARGATIRICAALAARLGLSDAGRAVAVQGDRRVALPLEIDERVPDGCVWIPNGVPGSWDLGPAFGAISLETVQTE